MKRIDAILRRMDEREKKMASMWRELRKFVNKKGSGLKPVLYSPRAPDHQVGGG